MGEGGGAREIFHANFFRASMRIRSRSFARFQVPQLLPKIFGTTQVVQPGHFAQHVLLGSALFIKLFY